MKSFSGVLIGFALFGWLAIWGWVGYELIFGEVYYLVLGSDSDQIPEYLRVADSGDFNSCVNDAAFFREIGVETVRCEEVPLYRHCWNVALNFGYQATLWF
ncbi:hypothetical protein [Guyparkeria halopsychrophila]|uniref:hypothetical protein n=1 Tax=Guyparkeria halopsychrophila TaxID=3139421 RepID=UPI0037C7070F